MITMVRPLVIPAAEKQRLVLAILAGELTVAAAARQAKVSEQSMGTWKWQFLEAAAVLSVKVWAQPVRACRAAKSRPSR
jgi:transposase-like protein